MGKAPGQRQRRKQGRKTQEGMYSFTERSSSMSSDLMALNEAIYFLTLLIVYLGANTTTET